MLKLPAVHMRQAMRDRTLLQAIAAEFVGVLLFQLLAGGVNDRPVQAAATFTALMYGIKHVSGGHLNPAVSLSAACTGHIDWTRGLLYVLAQLLGGICGAALEVVLMPNVHFGKAGPGCHLPSRHLPRDRLFGWEVLLTTFFVLVMYAADVVRPGHGDAGPLAAGLALYTVLATGGVLTGYDPVNPARSLSSSLVFNCHWEHTWVYLVGQVTGVVVAVLLVLALYGRGVHYERGRAQGAGEELRESLVSGEHLQGPGALGSAVA